MRKKIFQCETLFLEMLCSASFFMQMLFKSLEGSCLSSFEIQEIYSENHVAEVEQDATTPVKMEPYEAGEFNLELKEHWCLAGKCDQRNLPYLLN